MNEYDDARRLELIKKQNLLRQEKKWEIREAIKRDEYPKSCRAYEEKRSKCAYLTNMICKDGVMCQFYKAKKR
jgi:hypothetical protein